MRRTTAVAAVLVLFLWMGTGVVAAQNPVEISNATELQDVRDDLDADYVLVDDIDLSDVENFEPIGNEEDLFTGTFNGNKHTISNLTISQPDDENVGLFRLVGEEGTVNNVSVTDAEITGSVGYVGVLVGRNAGDVTASRAEGKVTGSGAGGLVGNNLGLLSGSHAEVEVTGDSPAGGPLAGGLVGNNDRDAEVRGSSAVGNVTAEGEERLRVGGLIGSAAGEIHNSHATGNVRSEKDVAGGLVGLLRGGRVHGSYATGDVEAEEDAAGGLVGYVSGDSKISNSHSMGEVTGKNRVGGLVGFAEDGEMTSSHATGNVTGVWIVGGLVGLNDESSTITGSHAEGEVDGYAEVGALVGENKGEVSDIRAEGEVDGESRTGGLVGDLDAGSLADSRWEGNTESFPSVGIRKTGTEFKNITPETVGDSGTDAGRPPPSEPGGEIWTFEAGDAVSSATVVGGTVYLGSWDGHIYAVDSDDGSQEWSSLVGGAVVPSWGSSVSGPHGPTAAILTSTTVAGDVVYTARQSRVDDEIMRSVRALDASTGDEIWDQRVQHISSSPTVSNGTLYVGGGSTLYAVSASTGEEEWRYRTEGRVTSSPTVVDGTVYIGDKDAYVHAVDVETGEAEWELPLENRSIITSSATVADGTVYVGAHSSDGLVGFEGGIHAIDVSDGTEVWSSDKGGGLSTPTVADGTVYVGGWDKNVYAIDASTGEEEWGYVARTQIKSSPTVADGTVYIGGAKYLHALDASTGEEQWRFEDRERGLTTSPTVVNGTVYVGSESGNLYAINAGVSGSSEGSRVLLGTLGHHHTWAEEQAKYIDVDRSLPVPAVVGIVVLITALVGGVLLRRRSE